MSGGVGFGSKRVATVDPGFVDERWNKLVCPNLFATVVHIQLGDIHLSHVAVRECRYDGWQFFPYFLAESFLATTISRTARFIT